MYTQAK